MEDANNKLATMRAQYATNKLTRQPQIVQVGEAAFLVAVDDYRWPFDNVIKALDVCFKLIQVSVKTCSRS